MPATPVTVADLTAATLDGTGVFDTLMKAARAHLESEFTKGRIKGPEYATVYLGTMEAILQNSVAFLLQSRKSAAEVDQVTAQTALLEQQRLNALAEHDVLVAQEAKLQAEITLTGLTGEKTTEEKLLLTQKTATELAQTRSLGVDDNSVVGKQKLLYAAQTDGFKSDAKQKAAKIMVDTWSVRRTTDEATVADSTNMLYDTAIGRAINTLLADVGA